MFRRADPPRLSSTSTARMALMGSILSTSLGLQSSLIRRSRIRQVAGCTSISAPRLSSSRIQLAPAGAVWGAASICAATAAM